MAQDIFKRVEVKYLLNEEQYEEMMKRLEPYMQIDEYGLSTISSIYYDTDTYDVARKSMEKPVYKEKLRLRVYGEVKDDSTAFLELKKKYKGVVYKRRISLPYKEAEDYLVRGIYPKKDSQILREIDYFIKFYHPSTGTLIRYDRIAMFCKNNKDIRITVDKNIRTRFNERHLSNSEDTESILKEGEHLMEIKVPGAMPMWLTKILSDLKVYPHSFSKYGSACRMFLEFENPAPESFVTETFATDKTVAVYIKPELRKETVLC